MDRPTLNRANSITRGNWLPQLDGLRAIAVTLVFLHHWTVPGLSLGIVGVDLFFVLSGFLITGILLRERLQIDSGAQSIRFSIRQFCIRRFLRIFPLYYFCLILFAVLGRFGARETFPWFFFYLSNVFFLVKGQFEGPFSHFWTLAVEEQFYLFWPWVVLVTPIKRLQPALLTLILFAPLSRLATSLLGYPDYVQTSTMVWANLDTLGVGALLACLSGVSESRDKPARRWLTLAALSCFVEIVAVRLIPVSIARIWLDPLAVTTVSVWVVWRASTGFEGLVGQCLSHPIMTYLGRISYGLYVWHMFAPSFLRNILHLLHLPESFNAGVIGFVLMYSWTVATASLTWFLLEKPINGFKRYFPYCQAPRYGMLVRAAEVSPSS